MRAQQRVTAPWCFVLVLAGILWPTAAGAAPPELKKLHILLVFDTNELTGLEKDLVAVQGLLRLGIPQDRMSVTVLKGDPVTPENVLKHYLRDLRAAGAGGPQEGF